jgi:hypothetical protein
LICVGASEEWARNVYALWGLRAVKRQVGLTRGTRWPAGSSADRMVARKARRSRRSEPVQGCSSQPESARRVCGGSPQNRRVTWLSHKTKTGGSASGDGIRARREATMPADAWRDRRACVGRTRPMGTMWPCDEEECYMTYLPLIGCIATLVLGVVWSFAWPEGDSYILALGFPGEPSIQTDSHFLAP